MMNWQKSNRCKNANDGHCVEVAVVPVGRWVRDSKLGDRSPVLSVPATQFAVFTGGIRGGEFG
jgi:hypothetical protein